MKRGYEERHYDAMLITMGAMCISEHRLKPDALAAQARSYADAFVAELVKMDQEVAAAEKAAAGGEDLTHDSAEPDDDEEIELKGSDTEPPPAAQLEQAARLEAQRAESRAVAAESKALDESLKS